jgi:putative endonuclease
MTNDELGNWGEVRAKNYLIEQGFQIIGQNIRFKKWEVDIVALDGEELVIVEVKTRQTAEIGEPWRAVTQNKQRQIIKVADFYVKTNQIDRNVRFDIVSIVHNTYRTDIEHIKYAFYPRW